MAEEATYWICRACGTAVSNSARKCSKCGASRRTPALSIVTAAVLGAVFLLVLASPRSNQNESVEAPISEQQFIEIVKDYSSKYDRELNPVAQNELRRERSPKLVSSLGPSLAFSDWTGTVRSISSTDDYANVAISISSEATLQTGVHLQLSIDSKIARGATAYKQLIETKIGDKVIISGHFFSSPNDGVAELSYTPEGSMKEPSFLISLSSIKPPPK